MPLFEGVRRKRNKPDGNCRRACGWVKWWSISAFPERLKIVVTVLKKHDLALFELKIQCSENGTKWHLFLSQVAPNGTSFPRWPHHADRSRKNRIVPALSVVKYTPISLRKQAGWRKTSQGSLAYMTFLCHNKLKNVTIKTVMST